MLFTTKTLTTRRRAALVCATALLAIAADSHANAGEASMPQPASSVTQAGKASTGPNTHPITREEMFEGMIEAERVRSAASRPDAAIDNRAMLEKWGVQVLTTSYSANGFWVVFRFRVADAEKAKPLFDTRIKPYLQVDKTGVKMAVPSAAKIGSLRTTDRGGNIKPDKIYTIMFANPGFQVAPGDKVSVVIGDFKAEHMTVRGERTNLRVKSAGASAAAKPE